MSRETIDLAAIRARLANAHGKQFWRSLDELAETEEFRTFLHREFPAGVSELRDPRSRRSFLKLMGAAFAMAGLSACASGPREKIVPYVDPPTGNVTPGQPVYYSTAMPQGGFGLGVLAESHIGRPTKIEGNPDHPASLGATDVFAQASVLSLYDPDRAKTVTRYSDVSTWEAFLSTMNGRLATLRANQGAGMHILTETITSPTLGAQMQALLQAFPQARWYQYDPFGLDNVREGAQLAFGQYVNTTYNFAKAARMLALDADFLSNLPGSLRYAREFIDGRRVSAGHNQMNRLYAVESMPTITGAMADHRLPLRASQVEPFARAVAQALGVNVGGQVAAPEGVPAGWIDTMVRDLQQHKGASIVIAGVEQPPVVHALAHAMNQALGNVGATVVYTQPVEVNPVNQLNSLRELAQAMNAGQVNTLLIVECNPVLTAPVDFNFGDLLRKVEFTVHMSPYFEETSALCQWHLPQLHYLESWGDVRAFNGAATIMQPLIMPLYQGKSAYDLLAALNGNAAQSSYDVVRAYWQGQRQGGDFEAFWRKSLHDGIVADTELPPVQVSLNGNLGAQPSQSAAQASQGLEINFRPDPMIGDGRWANNAWLQEMPKPMTTVTWDNVALISPATAQRLALQTQDLVELTLNGRSMRIPAWIMPGHADDAVTVSVGYGRTGIGSVADGVGFNAYSIRSSDARWFGAGADMRKTGEQYPIASVELQYSLQERDMVRTAPLPEFLANPLFAQNEYDKSLPNAGKPNGKDAGLPSLLPEYRYTGHAWGMSIDLTACIGCNACTIACQAENNIPTVGKHDVLIGRSMHWIKVDRYYAGNIDNPDVYFQPRPCMHCEKAPCELVCPVEATLHNDEGLNQMVYNRCIGTRYCSNNCPYKVRRFNFIDYTPNIPVINLVRNPDVTVRTRGVMEKCSYCIQRIEQTRIESEKDNRTILDGEIQTACQQVCPTRAIVFGDINDTNSAVARLKTLPLNYGMLAELGTQPRTTYLARVSNPNPELKA
ncbi:MAG TPA: TAT-variant-translocated molybdopterin oxidoreductase [Roseiflexaceae bacterium]|nr:TAT-variant-translocated molybdopterin oxidoreductase [Roseiflexaceae bacterium]